MNSKYNNPTPEAKTNASMLNDDLCFQSIFHLEILTFFGGKLEFGIDELNSVFKPSCVFFYGNYIIEENLFPNFWVKLSVGFTYSVIIFFSVVWFKFEITLLVGLIFSFVVKLTVGF